MQFRSCLRGVPNNIIRNVQPQSCLVTVFGVGCRPSVPHKRHYSVAGLQLHMPWCVSVNLNIEVFKCYSRPFSSDSCKYSEMSTLSNFEFQPVLRLDDYDCIGLDLDNTLCEYKVSPVVEMEYDLLAKFLVKEKGYDPLYLLKPLDASAVDFIQKGLIVDFAHGNLLKILENGTIHKASHGTKFLSEEEIVDTYGKDRKWEVTSEFCKNMLAAWNGPLSERMRPLLDYFDIPASLAFARIIDSLDHKLGKPADIYNVWPDVYAALEMYRRENFSNDKRGYFDKIKSDPLKFITPCGNDVVNWLTKIKETKMSFLVTGSNSDFASLTAETCLGKNWRSLFDVVVCYARKPGFFSGCRPFIELDGFMETNPIDGSDLEHGKIYSQGNWQELYQFFGRQLGKKEPKCLYIGDNLIQDVYAPAEYTKCDTVAVVEELSVEKTLTSFNTKIHPSETMISSNSWGSYFLDDEEHVNTVWNGIIQNYSNICISSLSVLSENPMNHEYTSFCKGSLKNGYHQKTLFATVEKKVIVA